MTMRTDELGKTPLQRYVEEKQKETKVFPDSVSGLVSCRLCRALNPVGIVCTHPGILTKDNFIDHAMEDLSQDFLDELMEEVNEEASQITPVHEVPLCIDNNIIKRNKYMREIKPGVWVDVYDVIAAFEVNDGGFQHALKKILAYGQRGHKNEVEDRSDIAKSIQRSNEIFEFKHGEI